MNSRFDNDRPHARRPQTYGLRAGQYALFVCGLVLTMIAAAAQAAAQSSACTAGTQCVNERATPLRRGQLEAIGPATDPSDQLNARPEHARYWLRCWQRGVLINERVVNALPVESRSATPIVDGAGVSIAVFDLKNATCIAETTAPARP